MSEIVPRTLKNIALFAGLDEVELEHLHKSCKWRSYRNGERILESGSPTREVFFLVHGSASAVNYSFSGREIAFAAFTSGDYFGELSAIDAHPRSASVVATEPSLIATITADTFLDLLRRRGEVTFRVFERLVAIVRASDTRIMELSTLAAAARVYTELLRMAKPEAAVPGLWVVRPLPPLREIAGRASTTRETVTRSLSQLYPTGVIRRRGRNLYITDRNRFEVIIKQLRQTGSAKAR